MILKFKDEWTELHAYIEKYERFSLLVKLTAVLVSVLSIGFSISVWIAILFILVLWLQDGIWKTFQKRLETRIFYVEKQIKEQPEDIEGAFQYYSQWENKRQGVVGLVKEYVLNSLKPTVAFPYIALVVITPVALLYGS